MRQKHNAAVSSGTAMSVAQRKISSQEEINKRLSLPADLKLPGTAFTNISTIFLSFFYLFSIFFLNRF
jgi:hypothetical protein